MAVLHLFPMCLIRTGVALDYTLLIRVFLPYKEAHELIRLLPQRGGLAGLLGAFRPHCGGVSRPSQASGA